MSGTPKRRLKRPKTAERAAILRSHHSASSIPPATAGPSIAAITGFPSLSRVGPIGPNSPSGSMGRVSPSAIALRSAPAQNAPPAPVSTATSAFGSASKRLEGVKQGARGREVDRIAPLGPFDRHDRHALVGAGGNLPWLASRMARFSIERIARIRDKSREGCSA